MNLDKRILLIPLGIMITTLIVILLLDYTYASNNLHTLESYNGTFDCEHTVYDGHWNLTYLRNVTSLCSNGGG